jgi:hypothetical protein
VTLRLRDPAMGPAQQLGAPMGHAATPHRPAGPPGRGNGGSGTVRRGHIESNRRAALRLRCCPPPRSARPHRGGDRRRRARPGGSPRLDSLRQ